MDTVKVACGVILEKGKVFVCRRKKEKSLGGYWEFPGGKVENNESYEESLVRELKEELEMVVDVKAHFKTVIHEYEKFIIELIAFICDYEACKYSMTDHDMYEWIDVSELIQKKLAPADIPIAKALIESKELL